MVAKSSPWPAFNVERRAAAALKPYEKNARTHSPEQVAQIAASIREWGWTQPILVDEKDGVLAGHGRLLAALELGAAEVPVIVAKGWSKAQKRAYVLADNQLALNAGWDEDLLRVEIESLGADGFDLTLAGFTDEAQPEPETAPAPTASLADRFGIPPFSVLNAREGWWQDRKRAWLALGIQSELGRGEQLIPNGGGHGSKARYDGGASPGGSMRPAADYGKTKARGDGRGRSVQSPETRPAS